MSFLICLSQNISKQLRVIDKHKRKTSLKISEEIYFKLLELEREAAATMKIYTHKARMHCS